MLSTALLLLLVAVGDLLLGIVIYILADELKRRTVIEAALARELEAVRESLDETEKSLKLEQEWGDSLLDKLSPDGETDG